MSGPGPHIFKFLAKVTTLHRPDPRRDQVDGAKGSALARRKLRWRQRHPSQRAGRTAGLRRWLGVWWFWLAGLALPTFFLMLAYPPGWVFLGVVVVAALLTFATNWRFRHVGGHRRGR